MSSLIYDRYSLIQANLTFLRRAFAMKNPLEWLFEQRFAGWKTTLLGAVPLLPLCRVAHSSMFVLALHKLLALPGWHTFGVQ